MLAPEWEVLLAGSALDFRESDRQCIQSVLTPRHAGTPPNWEEVLRLADHHGTTSLLCQNLAALGDVVPAPVLASFRQRQETNVHKSLFLTRELIRILDCLDALGIKVLPYKGVVLSESYYGDMAMRQAGDMDLFVRKGDVSRIKSAVRDLGYRLRVEIPEAAEPDYIASGYEYTFDSAAGKNLLELQWALQPRFYAVDYDMGGIFERAVNVTFAGHAVKTAAAGDLLLVLALHAAKHVWGRLIWLCDIAQILKRENLNWDWVQAQAQELGIVRILRITLLLTNRFLKVTIPSPVTGAISSDSAVLALSDDIAGAIAAGRSCETQQPSYFRLMMRLRERRMDRLRFLTRLALTPGPGEWEAVHLPRALFPLYRLVRMARLIGRFARS
jgi:Uncharacterised nucleotidyltransferase